MAGDQFPLGTSNGDATSRGGTNGGGAGGIDANSTIPDQELTYKASKCGRLWFVFYSARSWWHIQRSWVKAAIYMVPIVILFIIVILLAICLAIALKKRANSASDFSSDNIRTAGRIVSAMNLSADPCVNFYEYACGGFAQNEEIPIGKKMTTQFTKREAVIMKQLKQLLDKSSPNPSDKVAVKVQRYYKSCLNSSAIEVNGIARLRQMVADLGGFAFDPSNESTDGWSLEDYVTRRSRYTMTGLFQVGISQDFYNTSRNVIFLDRGRLGLGVDTRDFYLNKSLDTDPVLTAYANLLQTYVQLIGSKSVSRKAILDVLLLEQRLAAIHTPMVDRRNVARMYQPVTLDTLTKNAPYINWSRYLTNLFANLNTGEQLGGSERIIVLDMPYFVNLTGVVDKYIKNTPNGMKVLQNYIVLLAVSAYAPRMGSEFTKAYTKFLTVYSGNRGTPDPWLDCLGDTNVKLSFSLGKMYIDRYSPADHKNRAMTLIKDVRDSYRKLILNAIWMDEWTRAAALDKLDAMVYDVAYPDWIRDADYIDKTYANFTVTDDYTANLFEYYNHTIRVALRRYRARPDPKRWGLTPQTVNGVYEATQNTIFVAAALLNEPFFYMTPGIPDAMSYGSMGSMIGHEIAHGFDDKGRQFDKFGNIRNWWTVKTLSTYVNHTQCFVRQYNSYTIDSYRIKGQQTLNENIADYSGLRAAYMAYKKAQSEGRISDDSVKLPGLGSLNSDQLFFLSFAQNYCSVLTKEALRNQVTTDSHSPAAIRIVGTLSNSVEFTRAFQCNSVTTMSRKEKCFLW